MEIRFFAGAAEAAGRDTTRVEGADGLTAAAVVEVLARDNEQLARVLQVSSLLADGVRVEDRAMRLEGVKQLDVLPPFAGG